MPVNFRFFSVCCLLLLTACTTNNEDNTTKTFDENVIRDCKFCNVSFWITHFSRTHIEGSLERFKITADELSKRKRKGRIIEFVNYNELYFKGLTVSQSFKSNIVKLDMSEINLLSSLDGTLNTENNGQSGTIHQIVNRTDAEVLGNELSRVLVDDIKINFKPAISKNQSIVIKANYAKILTDTMIMRLEGNVTLQAKKCNISSNVAIWSNTYNGLFFSEPFQFNHKSYRPPAFFQITDTGKCQKVQSVHEVEYFDKLDTVEDEIFKSMPMSVQLLFGLMGSPTNLTNVID